MKHYLDLLRTVLERGTYRDDRTGTGTYSIFGAQVRFSLEPNFPLLTTKKLHLRSIIHELLWFLDAVPEEYKEFGNTNIKYLVDHGVGIWNEWPHKAYCESEGEIPKGPCGKCQRDAKSAN